MSEARPVTFFFMHIMKTAGSTFARHIQRNFRAHEVYPSTTDKALRIRQYLFPSEFGTVTPEAKAPLRLFQGHFAYVANEVFGADLTITLVRDPIERTISHLRHCQREPADEHRSLEEIYEGVEPWTRPFTDFQVRQFALTSDDERPFPTIDAARYARAVENLEAVAVLGLTAEFDRFTDELTARFGWAPALPGRLQVAPPGPDVTAAFRRRLVRDNEADIEFYQHARRLVGARVPQ